VKNNEWELRRLQAVKHCLVYTKRRANNDGLTLINGIVMLPLVLYEPSINKIALFCFLENSRHKLKYLLLL
jgi:hypothetical protein